MKKTHEELPEFIQDWLEEYTIVVEVEGVFFLVVGADDDTLEIDDGGVTKEIDYDEIDNLMTGDLYRVE